MLRYTKPFLSTSGTHIASKYGATLADGVGGNIHITPKLTSSAVAENPNHPQAVKLGFHPGVPDYLTLMVGDANVGISSYNDLKLLKTPRVGNTYSVTVTRGDFLNILVGVGLKKNVVTPSA